jgi:hypothetical protein
MRALIVITVALCALAIAPAAVAGEAERELAAARRAGSPAEALEAYRRAYAAAARFDTAASLGLAELAAGAHVAAANHLAEALLLLPEDAAPELRARLSAKLERAAAHAAAIHVEVEEGAHVRVAGRYVGVAPLARAVFVSPGVVVVEASRDGARATVRRRAAAGAETTLRLELAEDAGDPLPYVLIGGGLGLSVAALAVGTGLLVGGENRVGDAAATRAALDGLGLGDPCTTRAAACEEIEEDGSMGDTLRLAGGILVGGGAAALAGTIAYAITLGVAAEPGTTLTPILAPGTAGVLFETRF